MHILSNMQEIVCTPNNLLGDDPEDDLGCVAMGTRNMTMETACNITEVDRCIAAIHKAFNNPFLSHQQFCR